MPIPKQKYKELKEMYDFQRKVQYNKEKLRKAVEVMLEEPDVLFNDIWSRMKEDEMVEIPKGWVPQDDKLKIEGEE
jgi:vacuolar-type H+-ATPase subunit I/STV1